MSMIRRPRAAYVPCPHCLSPLVVRRSEQETRVSRSIDWMCLNSDCAATFVGQILLLREVQASRRPNPNVRLPRGRQLGRPPANDDVPSPANDEEAPPPPAAAIMSG
jgi:hypothetical protein